MPQRMRGARQPQVQLTRKETAWQPAHMLWVKLTEVPIAEIRNPKSWELTHTMLSQ